MFEVILVDPDWSLVDLDRLAIPPVASPNAVLFLWSGPDTKFRAYQIGAAWGFGYRTTVYWDSMAGRVHELLVFARPKPNLVVTALPAIIRAPATDGSRPDEFRRVIERATGAISSRRCLEVFARRKVPGWTPAGLHGDVRGDLRKLYEQKGVVTRGHI